MKKKLKILNAYAGIGGNRLLWGDEHEITAIEYDEATADVYKSYFPYDNVIITDAHQYILDHYKEFDFIWASPPCPSHSDIRRCIVQKGQCEAVYPDMSLYQEILLLKNFLPKGAKFVIENVIPYYEPLIKPDKIIHRHLYWCNFYIHNFIVTNNLAIDKMDHNPAYGFDIKNSKIKDKRKALRNLVIPEMGKHILDCALDTFVPQFKQQYLFQ